MLSGGSWRQTRDILTKGPPSSLTVPSGTLPLSRGRNVRNKEIEKAILVGVITPEISESTARDYLDELAFLTKTAGAEPVRYFLQRVEHTNPRTFVNKGKIQEIAAFIAENEITLAIFDDELSPKPNTRNIQERLNY